MNFSRLITVSIITHNRGPLLSSFKSHFVWDGSTLRNLFDAAGITTQQRVEAWLECRTPEGVGILTVICPATGLERVLVNGDCIHIDPAITE